MKVTMAQWVGGIKNLPLWFKSGEDKDVSLEQIKELYDTGNNVMLFHSGDQTTLFVDNKRFTQR
jgi:hypothetical protein